MNLPEPSAKDVAFDLKTPCNDCPFRTDVPLHEGVCNSLPKLKKNIENETFAHTCHKTDPRSDGYEEGYKGKLQQCAGSRIMLKKDKKSPFQRMEVYAGIYERENGKCELDMDAPVYSSFLDMGKAYMPMLEEKVKKIKYDEIKVHIRRRGK